MSAWLRAGRLLVIAHRGASAAAPENTLAAFRRAADDGADGIELDVRATSDGHLVVLHDADVSRTTDGAGAVAALTLAQLRRLDAGSWFGPAFAGERVPLLEEVLGWARGRLLVDVEVKAAGLEDALVEVVRRTGTADQVLVSAFDPQILVRTRERAPDLPLGLLQVLPDPDAAAALGVPVWLPAVAALTDGLLRRSRERGLRVIPWTAHTEADLRRAAALGVDGIIVNDPAWARRVLTSRVPPAP
ncbi:MAG: glycerophosphodiester phosphodiesterase family protein [Armatimonadota bacterium]|nr:glycerophosphodiester phosphodiesterase family protein [Armatimonadota bacterium]MDR7437295.1 glycerophosphodiester phosphodiesterase family protein [Armatimonadota bacterium]MDR7472634.1 glycerophosphodiester phosphodiesterase family protein [Armatimonadota bacterium]MDR7507893.1 glycerophosphodiester phosphodiesterase family protein [Armatimonadota bacterium]MDR7509077.1 glycerophosphodiester phosphodiesterase family protein [Armatimonadota bacterium]